MTSKLALIADIRGQIGHLPLPSYYRVLQMELKKMSREALQDLSNLLRDVEQMQTS